MTSPATLRAGPTRQPRALALAAAAGFYLVGCIRQIRAPDCVSACGLRARYFEGSAPIVCEELDRGEAVALTSLDGVNGISARKLCALVHNWYLDLGHPASSTQPNLYETNCDLHSIALFTFDAGGLAHELVHASDDCATPQHQGWIEKGYYAAIARARIAKVPPKPSTNLMINNCPGCSIAAWEKTGK